MLTASRLSAWRAYAPGLAAVAIATAIGVITVDRLSLPDHAMLYLAAIMIGALRGRGPGIAAAALSVAAYNFFFIDPRYTFAVADLDHVVTFAVMFIVGTVMGSVVARRLRVEREARDAAMRAQAEELRSSLLSTVSHDLRTPLAVITGMATNLRDAAPQLTGDQRESLDTIVEEAARLGAILHNLLAITRVESGAEVTRDWVPLEELVGAAVARCELALARHTLSLDVDAEAGAYVDAMLFEQLLINLLENAAKHTAPGTAIAVRAARDGGQVIIEVSDRGPGLPAGSPERLFDKFVRGPGQRANGAGLGLAVCRGIALAHGGEIEAERRPGGGATFRVRIAGGAAPVTPLLDAERLVAT